VPAAKRSDIAAYLRFARKEVGAQADQFVAGPTDASLKEPPVARQNRRLLWADGFISNISESFITSFLNPFAMALGATNSQIGILSALNNLASSFGLIPGARLAERARSRKWVAAISGGVVGRLLLLSLAILPFFLGVPAIIYAVIAVIALRSFFNQLGFPAWSTLVADLVPESIRGRYFASRNIGLAIAALAFTPIAGWIIERGGGVRGYQMGLIIAGVVGFIATAVFVRIQEPAKAQPQREATHERLRLAEIVRSRPEFAAFTGVALIWNLALMVAGPFFSVYLVRTLNATPTQIGILAAVYSLGNIVGQQFWGSLNDRRGAGWVMGLTGMLIPLIPITWLLAPNPWWLVPAEIFSGLMWAGYGLANFNLLLSLAPAVQRERYIALYQTAVFGAAFVGPLIGGALATTIGIRGLLMISSVGRFIAAILFLVSKRWLARPPV
jgi:MFS family permease